jgi:predicted RNase H-like HicB family nuclease
LYNIKKSSKFAEKIIMNFTAIITKTEDGWYVGQCEEIPEAITQAQSLDELKSNLVECVQEAIKIKKEQTKQLYSGKRFFHRKLELV